MQHFVGLGVASCPFQNRFLTAAILKCVLPPPPSPPSSNKLFCGHKSDDAERPGSNRPGPWVWTGTHLLQAKAIVVGGH
uniref:Secreted protein n=1 Tax=Globodera rostochiensis TaxID=31243 RepID=A0A914I508_GLORO